MSVEQSPFAVVDVSIVVKWLLPEPDSDLVHEQRKRWVASKIVPTAPDFLLIELHNIFWKKLRSRQISPEAPLLVLAPTFGLDLNWFTSEPLLPQAWRLACNCRISIYDALYAALAYELRAPLYTADHALAEKLKERVSVTLP